MLSTLTAITAQAAPPARKPTPAADTEGRESSQMFARLLDQAADRSREAGRAAERASSPTPAAAAAPEADGVAAPLADRGAANAAPDEPASTAPGAIRRKPQAAPSGERKPVARLPARADADAATAAGAPLPGDADAASAADAKPLPGAASAKGKPAATAADDATLPVPSQPAQLAPATLAAAHAAATGRAARATAAVAAGRAAPAASAEGRSAQAPWPGNTGPLSARPTPEEDDVFAAVASRSGIATEALPAVSASLDGSPPTSQAPAAAAPAAAAIAEATVAARPGSSAFAPQLGAQIATFVRDGVEHARLHLHPADMGPVWVQIQIDGSQAQVHLAAEHPLTRQALEQAMPLLAGSLREAGLTLTGGGVFEQARQGADQTAQDPASRGRREAGTADDRLVSAETRPLATPLLRRRGVVDLVA